MAAGGDGAAERPYELVVFGASGFTGQFVGTCVHDRTWKSAVYGLADQDNLRKLRKKIGYAPVPVVGAKLKRRGLVFFNQEFKEYSIPFMGSDASVVKRSQRYLHTELQETPSSKYVELTGEKKDGSCSWIRCIYMDGSQHSIKGDERWILRSKNPELKALRE